MRTLVWCHFKFSVVFYFLFPRYNVGQNVISSSVGGSDTLYLVFGMSFPLSAEAVIKFGPMHIPIATKGYENLFVALANHIRVDGSTLCSAVSSPSGVCGAWRSPSRNWIWCILALKSDWWQQIQWFFWESNDQISCRISKFYAEFGKTWIMQNIELPVKQ